MRIVVHQKRPLLKAADRQFVYDEMWRATWRAASVMHADLMENGLTNRLDRVGLFMQSAPGHRIASRTGRTRQRISFDVFRMGNTSVGVVGSPDKHVLDNELGATIRPKTSKMLTIPTVNMLTPAGRLKAEWESKLAGGGWRNLDWKAEGLFIWRGRRRGTTGAFIARKRGKRIELLAYLAPSVNLMARHMFRESAKRTSSQVASIIANASAVAISTRVGP